MRLFTIEQTITAGNQFDRVFPANGAGPATFTDPRDVAQYPAGAQGGSFMWRRSGPPTDTFPGPNVHDAPIRLEKLYADIADATRLSVFIGVHGGPWRLILEITSPTDNEVLVTWEGGLWLATYQLLHLQTAGATTAMFASASARFE